MKIQDRLRKEANACKVECCIPLVPLMNAAADQIDRLEYTVQSLRGCSDEPPPQIMMDVWRPT